MCIRDSTDTDADDADIYDDEEYQTLISGAGDAHSGAEIGEQVCEAYFQAKRRWRNFTGRHTPSEECPLAFVRHAARTTTSKLASESQMLLT
eukprot:8476132-Prorocentrum_lima.AAC.1